MQIAMDPDVKRIAETMQSSVAADKLVAVAEALALLAPSLWGGYPAAPVVSLALLEDTIS